MRKVNTKVIIDISLIMATFYITPFWIIYARTLKRGILSLAFTYNLSIYVQNSHTLNI